MPLDDTPDYSSRSSSPAPAGDSTPTPAAAPAPSALDGLSSSGPIVGMQGSPTLAGLGSANGQPAVAGPPANQHSTLNTVLKAVAIGLAGSAAGMGEKHSGEAAAAGVRTGIGLVQQGKENARADQTLSNQTAETANRTADTQSRIKFQSAQAAEAVARAAMYDKQLHQMDQEFQDRHNASTAGFMKEMQDMGLTPTIVTDNHGTGANAALQQLTDSHGGVPHMFVLNLGDKLVGYDLGQMAGNNAVREQVNKIAEIQGLGQDAYTSGRWGMIGKESREQLTAKTLSFFMPMPTKDNADSLLQQYKNYQQTYAQNPNADPALKKKLDDTVSMLQGSRDTFIKQKGTEAASVAAAEMPVKVATAKGEEKARLDTQLESANTEGQGARLVEGDMDPSQMSKRSNIYNATLDAADRYSMQKFGKHFDLARAQQDYKFAADVGTQNTLKMLDSLTGRDGRPGDLTTIADLQKKVQRTSFPALNDAAAWAKFQTGNPDEAAFKTGMLEVSDKLAKVFQGGGAGGGTSDAKMKQAQELASKSLSNEQFAATMGTLNQLLGNRKNSLIADNRYLQRRYNGTPSASAPAAGKYTPPAGAKTAVGANGHTIVVDGGKWVDAQTGQPIQ